VERAWCRREGFGKYLDRSVGPDTAPLGERAHVAPVTQAQIAATVAAFVGKDYHHDVPQAALPIAGC